jgi:hypothetical protein
VGANSNLGFGTLLVEEYNPSFVGVQEPDASETTEVVVATDPRRGNDRIRQAGCVTTTHHDKTRIRTGRDAEVAKTDRGVLVTASIFEMMLGPNETIGPEELRVIGGHSLGSIVKVSTLDRSSEDIRVLGAHRSVVLCGRITRPTEDVGETMWKREKRQRSPWPGDRAHSSHRNGLEQSRGREDRAGIDIVDTVEKHVVAVGYERIDFLQLVYTRETGRRKILVEIRIWVCVGDVASENMDIQTIGRCVVTQPVSTEVAHVVSPVSTESSSDTVSTIVSAGVVALALSNSAVGGSSVTCTAFI